ncbi:hypothetical protein [Duganella sp. P38]|jgi:hypothetical protein|uniref:hypothetical protein n=1 Tax=Duganella sp. P38 TaxID=3423949 RepID=UPI003D7AD707
MKPYQVLMALALAGSAALVLFGDNSPSAGIAEAVTRAPGAKPVAAARAPQAASRDADTTILRLTPRAELVGDSGDAAFAQGEGVFAGQNWNPPPPPAPAPSNAPPPAPVAPALPFIYIGKSVADGAWEVYLSRGDKTYSARAHTVIDGAYRIDRIAPPLMTLTYLPLNQQQQMNIGVFE